MRAKLGAKILILFNIPKNKKWKMPNTLIFLSKLNRNFPEIVWPFQQKQRRDHGTAPRPDSPRLCQHGYLAAQILKLTQPKKK